MQLLRYLFASWYCPGGWVYCVHTSTVYWGEPERAPLIVSTTQKFGVCVMELQPYRTYRHSICRKSLPALILRVLVNSNYSANRHELPTSSMATARTETTREPTYSMTRAIGATLWHKGFICGCHCLHCHYSPLTVEVTCHTDRPLQWPH